MGDAFVPISDEFYFLRKAPIFGSWAMLVGNPLAPRGFKLPSFCKDICLRRMDIFWVDNEQLMGHDMVRLKKYIHKLGYGKAEIEENKKRISQYVDEGNEDDEFSPRQANSIQSRIFDANIGKDQTVRFYIGELKLITEEHIQKNLIEAYDSVPIGLAQNTLEEHPVMGEYLRDIIGALQLDGMTKAEAMDQVVKWGEAKPGDVVGQFKKPRHYYRIKDDYYYAFNDVED